MSKLRLEYAAILFHVNKISWSLALHQAATADVETMRTHLAANKDWRTKCA